MNTLWIAVHLPDLALQSATRGLLPQLPVAISETTGNRTLIHQANKPAQDAGIRAGMTAAAAHAYASELVLLPRDLEKEAASLEKIALCALRYTPGTSIVRTSILLDVTASLTLFGGLGKLCGMLRRDLRDLGYHAKLGVAPTPLAAELLALSAADGLEARACTSFEQLPERLRPIPTSRLPWDDATRATLGTLGLRTLGQLYDAPRDGLLRRFGFACTEDLDRIAGIFPDPRAPLIVPDQFRSTYDFAAEIEDLAIQLMAIERLLIEANGFLGARGAAATTIQLTLRHGRQFTTRHEVKSSLPQRDAQQWLLLVREQLQRTPLPGPVTTIGLAIEALTEYAPPTNGLPGWLPDSRAQAEDRLRLLDRLAARLGKERVCTLATRAEHRPEEAWTSSAPAETGAAAKGATAAPKALTRAKSRNAPSRHNNGSASARARPHGLPTTRPRPAWLLDRPRALLTRDGAPVHHGPLTMIAGPERIQSGWWDNKPVDRDYFVARNPLGETCWVYRELDPARRWYLHGVFG
jgi:protein ImuB